MKFLFKRACKLFVPTTVAIIGPMMNLSSSEDAFSSKSYYGTLEPFASEAIYFLMLDRFVDGDPSNNHEDQGGEFPTWDQKLIGPNGEEANIGYLGGDFKGVMDNLDYLKDMGFTAIWTTPVMDNPDEHFTGGAPLEFGGNFADQGKTGYHGYWMTNFFVEDEHYISEDIDFEDYAAALHDKGFKVVFDIVVNHSSPSFTMPVDQPKFGELYDADWNLVADHQNLRPDELDPNNPIHEFYYNFEDFMELSNINDTHPKVIKYFTDAYLSWIEKGADAIRIDTIRHVRHSFWKVFTDNIRELYPNYFMFGESFVYDANYIAQHTLPKNGRVSVLDFPGQEAIVEVFGIPDEPSADEEEEYEQPDTSYGNLESYLHLTHGPYDNPYDLVTFYDNHDMARINATDEGFIDAHNWLFTSRGIPCIYYGSEMAFMKGLDQHAGNRNYYGEKNIRLAKKHPIYKQLSRIGGIRQKWIALQRGLQVNVDLGENTAVFYRVYQHEGVSQTCLVFLNKGDEEVEISASKYLQYGTWTNVENGDEQSVKVNGMLKSNVGAHSFSIWVNEDPIRQTDMLKQLQDAMLHK